MNIKTKLVRLDHDDLDLESLREAGSHIKEGGLVAFPTETVYGLGGDGLNPEAIAKIFKAKGRPQDNPLILHVSSRQMLEDLVQDIPEEADRLMEVFWPGPLTIIFKRSKKVPDAITAGLETVAIRMPDNDIARKLIDYSGRPIAAPSANTSGRPSPTRADHVYEDLDSKLDMILDGGPTGIGLESTVIDLSEGEATILRPGAVTLEDIEKVLGRVGEDPALLGDETSLIPKSPGQKYKHYAPRAEMILFYGSPDFQVKSIKEHIEKYRSQGLRLGVIASQENMDQYDLELKKSMGSQEDLEEIAHNLFKVYRDFDQEDVDLILSESVENKGLGKAIYNRMKKACGGHIVKELD